MISTWFSLLLKLLFLIGTAFAVGALFGAKAGWLTVCAALLAKLVAHIIYLERLQRWLKSPEERDIPDAWGMWGNVFVELYRLLRREAKARAQIATELDLFTQAVEAIPNGVAILNHDFHLLWCNRRAESHLGLRGAADYGLSIANLVRPLQFAEFVARAKQQETFIYRPPHNPGQVLSLETIPFGEQRKLLVSFDITQIERADTTRRDFIANVSHELRTPLTVIHGFLEHMTESPQATSQLSRRHLLLMAQQSDRMLKLVDDLLTLSQLEGGDNPPREEEIDMTALLATLAEEGNSLSDGKHEIGFRADAMRLKGGRDELRSAFGNLVSNAIRYTPNGGRIMLSWEKDAEGRGAFSVTDSGIGIAAEHIPRLTERFYRVDRGRSRETGGTGLGLAIVKHVLLRHQATLGIQSALGQGSTFKVSFPAWRCGSALSAPQGV